MPKGIVNKNKNMRKIKVILALVFLLSLTAALVPDFEVSAKGTNLDQCTDSAHCNNLTFRILRCDASTHGDLDTWDGLGACVGGDDGTDSYGFLVKEGDVIAKDDYIVVKAMVDPTDIDADRFNNGAAMVGWDTNYFSIVYLDDVPAWSYDTTCNALFPYPCTKQGPKWKPAYSVDEANGGLTPAGDEVSIQFNSADSAPAISEYTELGYVYLKADGASVASGGAGEIFFDNAWSSFDRAGDPKQYNSTDFQADFGGQSLSTDATLSSLLVTKTDGSTTYPLNPTFTPTTAAENQKVYSTKVPSDVSQIKISATANDNKVQGIKLFDGDVSDTSTGGTSIADTTTTPVVGTGTKSVNPGANEFTIAVTSENGNILNQVVNIYRLSNDADLSNLSVDGYSFAESFSASTLSYTISGVPYSTKSLNVVGAKHDSKASVTGLGSWTFDSDPTAATTFTRNVVVTPEECNYIPGNSEVVQGAS